MKTTITIRNADFDVGELYQSLATGTAAGAVVTFVGRVRDFAAGASGMWLEHYAGMTEKVLGEIVGQARQRWPIMNVDVIHRVGRLAPGDQIVFVGVSAAHRKAAFAACEFIIDYLKTEAPFWKKEGEIWVEAKDTDQQAKHVWASLEPR